MADHERLNQIQHWLIDACQKLNLPVKTPDDDFFEVGGSSLALVRLVAQVETKFSEHAISPDEFIEHSTMREIAASIVRNTEGRAAAAAVEGLIVTPVAENLEPAAARIQVTAESLAIYQNINNTAVPYPSESSIKELFERCVTDHSEKIALVHRDREYSYRELNELANSLAQRLRVLGVQPGDSIGICLERSANLIIALLAVIKCGAAYLPFDAAWPGERLHIILRDAACSIVVTSNADELARRFPQLQIVRFDGCKVDADCSDPAVKVPPNAIAYINFTSGTTGLPKGVPIQHRSVVRLVSGSIYAQLDSRTVLLQLSPVTFDAATFEIWGALLNGGTCILYPSALVRTSELRDTLRRWDVTVLFLTTALFNVIVDEAPEALDSVRTILTGGESYSEKHINKALARYGTGKLIHVYGPTECTTFTTFYPICQMPTIPPALPIGRPIQNTRIYVVKDDRLCLQGEVGEILVSGPGLSPGYLGSTQENGRRSFTECRIGDVSERAYRTGDYGYLLDTGDLVFQGRHDEQVKWNGYRIELAEVALILDQHPGIRQSYVTLSEGTADDRVLLAFVVLHGVSLTSAEIRDHLRSRLPGFMVPSGIHICNAMPLLPNGKVDRSALLDTVREEHLAT